MSIKTDYELLIMSHYKERNGSGPLAFPWCLLIVLVGWSQDHGPPRRRETSLLFYSYGTERKEEMDIFIKEDGDFGPADPPFSPIGRRFRIPWPIRGYQNEDRLSFWSVLPPVVQDLGCILKRGSRLYSISQHRHKGLWMLSGMMFRLVNFSRSNICQEKTHCLWIRMVHKTRSFQRQAGL